MWSIYLEWHVFSHSLGDFTSDIHDEALTQRNGECTQKVPGPAILAHEVKGDASLLTEQMLDSPDGAIVDSN